RMARRRSQPRAGRSGVRCSRPGPPGRPSPPPPRPGGRPRSGARSGGVLAAMTAAVTDLRWICDELARWIVQPPAAPPEWSEETWSAFREAAQVHGVAPLLWLRVRSLPSWSSSPIGLWLEDQTAWNARRVARLQGALAEVLYAFAAEEVPVLPIKGSVLA